MLSSLDWIADDTRLYKQVQNITDSNELQQDLDSIYKWTNDNNMSFNSNKFQCLCLSTNQCECQNYADSNKNDIIVTKSVKDLGIYLSHDLTFQTQIIDLHKRTSQLCGWVLRTFISRNFFLMLQLFKSLILSRLDFGSQLWSPHKLFLISKVEKVQRSFTKHIDGMQHLSYPERLKALKLYSLQRRRDRYIIIYAWKIAEKLVPNMHSPLKTIYSSCSRCLFEVVLVR